MMNELLRKRAIDVVDRLMSHPSTKPFLSFSLPSDPENQNSPPAESSKSLNSIRQRLIDNKYTKLQTWLNDVEQCWAALEKKNADHPTEDSQRELILAAENRRLFEKEKRAIDILTAQNWGNELVRLRGKIFELMIDPPPKIKTYATPFINSKIVKANQPSISDHDLNCFVEAANLLTSDEDNNEICRIISEFQPDLILYDSETLNNNNSTDMWFNVSKLNLQTFNALKTYIKSALEKAGLKYPE